MDGDLKLTHRVDGDAAVIEVDGELSYYTAPRLRQLVQDLVTGREIRWIALDLEQCPFLDATGLQVVVGVLKRVHALNGGVALICTEERILKIFRITGLNKYFLMADSEQRARTMLSCMRTGHLKPLRNAGDDVARHRDHRE